MSYTQDIIAAVAARNSHEPEFVQAVTEVVETLEPVLKIRPQYQANSILERIVEPERVIVFRVPWVDDKGKIQVNRGCRVQFNSAIGPYKGGIRFHPSVNLSILKFLGFEQTFKNSLTTLPMGGGKGGADFDPKGKSEREVMAFCQSFMTELCKYIGQFTDVPAGDIGVGAREVGYMFGQYKRIQNEFTGVLTGKGLQWGGSRIRPEATGFGAVYFLSQMLEKKNMALDGMTLAISGFGNVAWGTAMKATQLGAKVVTLSGPDGYVHDPNGLDDEKIAYMLELRASNNDVVAPYAQKFAGATFIPGRKPWEVPVDIAMPCACQNELNEADARQLIANGVKAVAEVSNMGCRPEAIAAFIGAGIPFGPGKAVNAGGVATSGLEMSQNSLRLSWSGEEVDARLKGIMTDIHDNAYQNAETFGSAGNYVVGANIAGFVKVADAMLAHGAV
ncbi:MAG: NADP-specific glutamate dehydrogenase [Kiritimatiellia bacterium]|jgi:glutamate dehydrogenase (NADP+)